MSFHVLPSKLLLKILELAGSPAIQQFRQVEVVLVSWTLKFDLSPSGASVFRESGIYGPIPQYILERPGAIYFHQLLHKT